MALAASSASLLANILSSAKVVRGRTPAEQTL